MTYTYITIAKRTVRMVSFEASSLEDARLKAHKWMSDKMPNGIRRDDVICHLVEGSRQVRQLNESSPV